MPRVVQVSSTSNLNVNTRDREQAEDFTDADDGFNKNHNQQEHCSLSFDALPQYLQFPIDYAAYNVVYCPSDNDPYCLHCEVGGEVVKYKKDARIWLHKSSDNNRIHASKNTNTPETRKATANEDDSNYDDIKRRLGKIQHYFQNVCASNVGYTHGPYRTAVGIDSDISSLGDSDADLTYSEESSPSHSITNTNIHTTKLDSRVTFADINEHANITQNESLSNTSMILETDIADPSEIQVDVSDSHMCTENASGNNSRSGLTSCEVARRLAPAIDMEHESLSDGLLDSAVNSFITDHTVGAFRRRRQRRGTGVPYTVGGPVTRSRRQAERDKMAFYNLRSRPVKHKRRQSEKCISYARPGCSRCDRFQQDKNSNTNSNVDSESEPIGDVIHYVTVCNNVPKTYRVPTLTTIAAEVLKKLHLRQTF
ncbi:hypothetical protein MAR_029694 [Mya arenaria]|uniref:Uncharacterized protein n=2 Tax=Mya arenaria TaxID=6604 RepID=A0ABY7DH35_MYAAR|nr:hypothetical protein MAR_029694 [Mya arenaria]